MILVIGVISCGARGEGEDGAAVGAAVGANAARASRAPLCLATLIIGIQDLRRRRT